MQILSSKITKPQDEPDSTLKAVNDRLQQISATKWLSGDATPKKATGNVGDYYLNEQSGEYFFKDTNGWERKGSFRGKEGRDGLDGKDGDEGLSAYEIWVKNGNKGTVNDFLISLVGRNGINGEKGDRGPKGEKGEKGDKGEKGKDGREIELRADSKFIQWRYTNESKWKNLIAIALLKGRDGQILFGGGGGIQSIREGSNITIDNSDPSSPVISSSGGGGGGVSLGETSTTAYRGDRGKIAYDHSQLVSGNPHNVTKADVGLGNVDNTSDLAKPISTATQTALDAKAVDADVVHDTGNETIAGIKTFSSDPLIPDEAYGVGWNGSLEPPTKNAVYDKIETVSTSPGGSNTQVQFNDGGVFGGDAGLTYNKTTDALTISGGLVVDATSLVVDDTNNRVGIGIAAPTAKFQVAGSGTTLPALNSSTVGVIHRTGAATNFVNLSLISGNTSTASSLYFGDTDAETQGGFSYNHSTDVFSVRAAGGVKAAFNSIGLAISNAQVAASPLHVFDAGTSGTPAIAATTVATFQRSSGATNQAFISIIGGNTNTSMGINFGDTDSETGGGRLYYRTDTDLMNIGTAGATRITIDSSGNTGIGATTPASKLDVLATGTFGAAGVSGLRQAAHTVTLSGADPTTYATFYAAQIGAMTLAGTNANQNVTVAAGLAINPPVKGSGNVPLTETYGLLINTQAVGTATRSYGLAVNVPTGATNNTNAIFVGGNVGINTTLPTAGRLEIAGTATDTIPMLAMTNISTRTTGNYFGQTITVYANGGSAATGAGWYGLTSTIQTSGGGTNYSANVMTAGQFALNHQGSGTVTNPWGFETAITNSATATWTDAVIIRARAANLSTGTITALKAFRAIAPTKATGTITTYHGIYVEPAPDPTNSYSAYFGGKVGIGDTAPATMLQVTNDTAANPVAIFRGAASQTGNILTLQNGATSTIAAVASDGRFAIGNVGAFAPTAWLDVRTASTGIVGLGVQLASGHTSNAIEVKSSTPTVLYAVSAAGHVGIGQSSPTAALHIKAGTATASTAPLKLTTGTALTTPEDGAIEYHSSHLYFTIGSTRYQLDQQSAAASGITRTITVTSGSFTAGATAATDYVYLLAGAHVPTMPTAVGNTNRYTFKNNHSANITFLTTSSQTIEGGTLVLAPSESVDLISDNANWFVI